MLIINKGILGKNSSILKKMDYQEDYRIDNPEKQLQMFQIICQFTEKGLVKQIER
jgi:hypothetical protein